HKTPRLPTIRATVDLGVRPCPCKDNSAAKVCERPHLAYRSKPLHKTPRLPTIRATVDLTVRACPCKDNSAAKVCERPPIAYRSKLLHKTPRLPTIRAAVDLTVSGCPCKDDRAHFNVSCSALIQCFTVVFLIGSEVGAKIHFTHSL